MGDDRGFVYSSDRRKGDSDVVVPRREDPEDGSRRERKERDGVLSKGVSDSL